MIGPCRLVLPAEGCVCKSNLALTKRSSMAETSEFSFTYLGSSLASVQRFGCHWAAQEAWNRAPVFSPHPCRLLEECLCIISTTILYLLEGKEVARTGGCECVG